MHKCTPTVHIHTNVYKSLSTHIHVNFVLISHSIMQCGYYGGIFCGLVEFNNCCYSVYLKYVLTQALHERRRADRTAIVIVSISGHVLQHSKYDTHTCNHIMSNLISKHEDTIGIHFTLLSRDRTVPVTS